MDYYCGLVPYNCYNPTSVQTQLQKIKAIQNIRCGYKVLIVIRGLPGSGKTYLANNLINDSIGPVDYSKHIINADNYFRKNWNCYVYDSLKLTDAHIYNYSQALARAQTGITPIIIDDMNIEEWQILPYAMIAVNYGYILEIFESEMWWKFDVNYCADKTKFNISTDIIREMICKYDHNITAGNLIYKCFNDYKFHEMPQYCPPLMMNQQLTATTAVNEFVNTLSDISGSSDANNFNSIQEIDVMRDSDGSKANCLNDNIKMRSQSSNDTDEPPDLNTKLTIKNGRHLITSSPNNLEDRLYGTFMPSLNADYGPFSYLNQTSNEQFFDNCPGATCLNYHDENIPFNQSHGIYKEIENYAENNYLIFHDKSLPEYKQFQNQKPVRIHKNKSTYFHNYEKHTSNNNKEKICNYLKVLKSVNKKLRKSEYDENNFKYNQRLYFIDDHSDNNKGNTSASNSTNNSLSVQVSSNIYSSKTIDDDNEFSTSTTDDFSTHKNISNKTAFIEDSLTSNSRISGNKCHCTKIFCIHDEENGNLDDLDNITVDSITNDKGESYFGGDKNYQLNVNQESLSYILDRIVDHKQKRKAASRRSRMFQRNNITDLYIYYFYISYNEVYNLKKYARIAKKLLGYI